MGMSRALISLTLCTILNFGLSWPTHSSGRFPLYSDSEKCGRRDALLSLPVLGAALFVGPRQVVAESQVPKKLIFETYPDGVRWADITEGTKSDQIVQPDSKVTFHVVGRLLGKQGWVFLNTEQQEDDPYRLQFGAGEVITGLEEGMAGMKIGGKRRIVIPSSVGYVNKSLEPIPRDFGNRQRLYTTVMNRVRVDREREALGEDLAGVVVMDVEVLRIRQ
uniref:peptidylprolyl isomerase n=1 Tax=Grammatophora oceanica TaxID=210454 RepID=A0A7S1Y3N3_9STRA|mmetsp:Transcript_25248/g.36943  ORF Transcript_25248/g.36943 Transcript_25248/m.36943 type:complete len:220 (+) Transcript_25248:33-692(+)